MARLLVLDEDENSRLIYSAILTWRGYVVELAVSCPDAVRRAEEVLLAAIVLDPGFADDEAVGRLCSTATRRGTRLLALTSRATTGELEALRAHPFDRVLVKPALPSQVAEAIDAMLTATA